MHKRPNPGLCPAGVRPGRRRILVGLGLALWLSYGSLAPAVDGVPDRSQSAEPIFRPPDHRPHHDNARLKELGIALFESKRLKLYTDVAAEKVQSLLPAVDAVYDALVDYFGPLLPNPERTDFQVTGYLMADKALFRRAGLLPEDLPPFLNGRHRGQEFSVNERRPTTIAATLSFTR